MFKMQKCHTFQCQQLLKNMINGFTLMWTAEH